MLAGMDQVVQGLDEAELAAVGRWLTGTDVPAQRLPPGGASLRPRSGRDTVAERADADLPRCPGRPPASARVGSGRAGAGSGPRDMWSS